jgi:hypothetical protein
MAKRKGRRDGRAPLPEGKEFRETLVGSAILLGRYFFFSV